MDEYMERWPGFRRPGAGRWAADYPDADTFANILANERGFVGQLCGSTEWTV